MQTLNLTEQQYTYIAKLERDRTLVEASLSAYISAIVHGARLDTATYHSIAIDEGKYVMNVSLPKSESNA